MNSPANGLKVLGVFFALFALVHIWRLLKQFDVIIGSHHIPLWVSGVAAVIGILIFIWTFWLACRLKHPQ